MQRVRVLVKVKRILGSLISFARLSECRCDRRSRNYSDLYQNTYRPFGTMNTRLSTLISFYRKRSHCGGSVSKFVSRDYSAWTLRRLVYARDPEIRCAAVWALGSVGQHSEYRFLGPFLRDSDGRLRLEADLAREQILLRIRSDWHCQFAQQIEDSMADSHWKSANRMVDRLVATHGEHPQSWLLRVSVRMCTSQLLGAIDDCRHLLSFDRDCYRACVFLGQSYWWMQRLEVAKECFTEANRIYPNWSASGFSSCT